MQTVETCKKAGFARMHVFPYSEREGTKAAVMEGSVPRHVREERARALIAVGHELERAALEERIGKLDSVLIEEEDAMGRGMGYTGGYMRVHVENAQAGSIVRVRITGIENNELTGDVSE